MRRGSISVVGDAKEVAVSPRPRYPNRHGKRSNPYSTIGIDKFESVHAELSAKRKYIAQKTGVPEAMVRFVASKKGWIPVVIGAGDKETGNKSRDGVAAGVSIVGSVEKNNTQKNGEFGRKDEGDDINGGVESNSISVLDKRSYSLAIPCSRFLKNTALGFLGVSAMWVKFIVSGLLFLAALFRNPNSSQEEIAEQKDDSTRSPRFPSHTVSAPTSPVRAHGDPTDFWATASPIAVNPKNSDTEGKHNHYKAKILRRAVSMDNRLTKPERSYRFYRPAMAYNANVGATVMILTLLCFIFCGQFCAIFFACACLYLFTIFREGAERMHKSNDGRMVDLQSTE